MIKQKRAISSYVLSVGILSLLIVGSWMAYDIYGAIAKSQITEEQQADIAPLIDRLNENALQNLRQRRTFSRVGELEQVSSINYDPQQNSQRVLVEQNSTLKITQDIINRATQEGTIKPIVGKQ